MNPIIQNLRDLIVNKQEILLEKLNFGACDASIILFKSKLNIELPQAFYDLYCLFNGSGSSGAAVWATMSLLPLSGILSNKNRMSELQNNGLFHEWAIGLQWKESYIPFLSDYSNSLMCIDMSSSFNGQPGQILLWNSNNSGRVILFDSFDKWLQAIYILIESFNGDLIINKEDYKNHCESNINKIVNTLNPEYPKFIKEIKA